MVDVRSAVRLAVAALVVAAASSAQAQPSTQSAASILVFPRVAAFSEVDTHIHIANVSNSLVRARCFYVRAGSAPPDVVEFSISLVARQPTRWSTALGRAIDPSDPPCTNQAPSCYGAGFDAGNVPAMPNFAGELLCVQVDASSSPIGGNALTGRASLRQLDGAEFAHYNAIGFAGSEISGTTGNLLELGPQYQSCAEKLVLQHRAGGAEDPLAGAGSRVDTELFLVTCAQDLDAGVLPFVRLELEATDELEVHYTSEMGFTGAAQLDLGEIFPRQMVGSDTLRTQVISIEPMAGAGTVGVIGVAETRHRLPGEATGTARVGANLTVEGSRYASLLVDTIVLPSVEVPE